MEHTSISPARTVIAALGACPLGVRERAAAALDKARAAGRYDREGW